MHLLGHHLHRHLLLGMLLLRLLHSLRIGRLWSQVHVRWHLLDNLKGLQRCMLLHDLLLILRVLLWHALHRHLLLSMLLRLLLWLALHVHLLLGMLLRHLLLALMLRQLRL